MDIKIKRVDLFNHLLALILLFPVIFSFIFALTRLKIPSYLFIIVVSLLLLIAIGAKHVSFTINYLRASIYILFIWILSGLFYTTSVFASHEKAISIVYNTIIPLLIIEVFFIFSKQKHIKIKLLETKLLRYSYALLWFSFFAFILFKEKGLSDRYTILGINNPIWFARYIGMLTLIIIACDKLKKCNAFLYIASIAGSLIVMFLTGSRGPLLSLVITYIFIQSILFGKKKVLITVAILVSVLFVGFNFLGGYLFESNFYSLYARLDLVKLLYDLKFDYLKGVGIGSYSLIFFGEDVVYYPHNIFLELFFENGIIGVFLFSIVLWCFFKFFQPNILFFLAIYYLLVSLPSGDIPGNNNLFIMLFACSFSRRDNSD